MSISKHQIWSHFALKTTYTPRPELRRGAANAGTELPTAEAGPGGTLCTSHASAASPRPLARTPRTKRNFDEDETKPISWFRVAVQASP